MLHHLKASLILAGASIPAALYSFMVHTLPEIQWIAAGLAIIASLLSFISGYRYRKSRDRNWDR